VTDVTPTPALDALAVEAAVGPGAPVPPAAHTVAATAPASPTGTLGLLPASPAPSAVVQASQSLLWRIEQDAAPVIALVLGAVDLVTGARAGRAVDLGAIGAGFAALGLPFLGNLL
jgi:hypothetical protein